VASSTDGNPDWPSRLRNSATQGRDQAIEELRTYLVCGLARSLAHRYGGRVDVEDVAQLAILKILSSLDSFRGRSKFETWAMSVAVRIGISELRRSYYRTVSLGALTSNDGVQFDLPDKKSPGETNQEEQQSLFTLLQTLIDDALSDRQRIAIRGTLAGLSVEVIAERLNSNRNAVYKLVHDARLRLRHGFEEAGVTAEDILTLLSRGA
jgi:RNA polymerase sigma factor (sigma-70 family)